MELMRVNRNAPSDPLLRKKKLQLEFPPTRPRLLLLLCFPLPFYDSTKDNSAGERFFEYIIVYIYHIYIRILYIHTCIDIHIYTYANKEYQNQ